MKNNVIICSLLIMYFFLNTFVLIPMNIPLYNEIINPMLWISICGVAVYLSHDTALRVKGEKDKTQSLLIILIIYIIVYFLLGLIFGFERTPYSKEIFAIIKNLWSFVGILFFQEFIREALIKNEKKKKINYIIIAVLFAILNINFSNFANHFTDLQTGFTYTASVLLPKILESAILTYLVYIGGAKFAIIYRVFVESPPYIVPIIPDLDWFGTAIIGIALPLAVYVYMNYVHVNRTERLSKRERKKYNPVVYIPVFAFIGILAGFVVGVFKYQPIAVMSGSMSPTFNRGDAVVVKRLSTQEKAALDVGDIIEFVSGSKYVIHRIVEVTNDDYGNKLFITKGDHNNTIDVDKAQLENIKGKVIFIVPFIGYPSVWLSGAIS